MDNPLEVMEIPETARLGSVISAGFATSYPSLAHAELIPTDILAAMRPSWDHDGYGQRNVDAFCLREVVVAELGLVLDGLGRPYRRSIAQHGPQNIAAAQAAIAATVEVSRLAGRFVLCVKPGAGNYGHWLTEMLPKAWLAQNRLDEGKTGFLVHDVAGPLRQVMLDSMALLGIGAERIRFLGRAPVIVEELIVIDGLTEHGGYMSPLVMQCLDDMARRLPPMGPQKLYVSRAGLGSRSFANDHEIEAIARVEGWTILRPGGLTLGQQVALFRGATAVAGVMGAGLTNIAFALPRTRVVNFAPASMPDVFFWFIAALRSHRYREVRCPQRPDRPGLLVRDQSLILPAQEFRAELRAAG